jgi:hypothetical protein
VEDEHWSKHVLTGDDLLCRNGTTHSAKSQYDAGFI